MSGGRKLRVGIDVGGTFTDVVAIDAATRELVARVKVPTTHDAARGVAAEKKVILDKRWLHVGTGP